ncbi:MULTISPECIES: sulfide/dihydroorotate dehydrogenase-like FAD/NAD-binding protein [Thermococcus]|uniref:Ferredoxin:NADP oxidoreductase, beta subunit n=1 Tax=Thermococcus sibiricus TaxID=172049 RepID=A0A101EMN7_9EURY|nr:MULTISPECIES: sulfide/dihydroorotate dehydrogenase-like FAD/NAD-binding protein [Thermococcus]KUK17974.1 MAG: Ferredoxin:NADP oxidoreductase, beta subunit [Thermococcus sibiricus]MBC7095625.1 sulfide/dihydroorotate dehydrogenase-like FAD/NAD-binding protein [Thermococcus sp.]
MGYRITKKENLSAIDFFMEVEAPHIAHSWKVGQFVVLIADEKGERVPMSVYHAENGKIGMFIRRHGVTTFKLWYEFDVGDEIFSITGPLGKPIEVKHYGNVVFVSDAVCAQAESYATLKSMKEAGNYTIAIQTFENAANTYPEKYLAKSVADEHYLTTEDGSIGIKGHYLDVLKELIEKDKVDIVFGGGKLGSLVKLAELTKPYGIPTIVTVRQIMVDGTGMCGSCRVLYDGEVKFACRDGPMFDAHKIDWEDAIKRNARFAKQEKLAKEMYMAKLKEKGVI